MNPLMKLSDSKKSSLSGMEKAIQDSIGIDAIKDATGVSKGDVYTHYYGDGVVRSDSENLNRPDPGFLRSKNIKFLKYQKRFFKSLGSLFGVKRKVMTQHG